MSSASLPRSEVERVVSYTAETGARRFSLLAPKDTYGNTVAAALRKTAKEQSLTIDRIELYDPKTKDFGEILDRVRGAPPARRRRRAGRPAATAGDAGRPERRGCRAAPAAARTDTPPPFDALLIADTGDRLKLLVDQLSAKDIGPDRVRILGTGAWDEPAIKQDRALAGAWFAAPEPPFRADFERSYAKTFGAPAPRLATLGYDATALAAVLVRERGRERLRRRMADQSGRLLRPRRPFPAGAGRLCRPPAGGASDRRRRRRRRLRCAAPVHRLLGTAGGRSGKQPGEHGIEAEPAGRGRPQPRRIDGDEAARRQLVASPAASTQVSGSTPVRAAKSRAVDPVGEAETEQHHLLDALGRRQRLPGSETMAFPLDGRRASGRANAGIATPRMPPSLPPRLIRPCAPGPTPR